MTLTPSKMKRKYEKRIIAVMNRVREWLEERFDCAAPGEFTCDEDYEWIFSVYDKGAPEDAQPMFDVKFSILESRYADGADRFGVNFNIDAVTVEGEELARTCPHNWSDKCWVSRKDPAAVEDRFRIFEDGRWSPEEFAFVSEKAALA